MSHEIATVATGQFAGQPAFMSVQQPAWHGLGRVLDNAQTVGEALVQGGLDFRVEKAPALFLPRLAGADADGPLTGVRDQFVTYRTDNGAALGVVGCKYTVVQNADALDFFDAIVGAGAAVIQTAGALGQGERVFLSARMPEHIHVPGDTGDIQLYVLLFNSHDGSGSIQALITPVRVVCNNTLMMALGRTSNRVKIRHTTSATARLQQAGQFLGLYDQFTREMETALAALVDKRLSQERVEHLVQRLFPSSKEAAGGPVSARAANTRQQVLDYVYGEAGGQQSHPGTAYQFYQGITGFFQNVKTYRSPQGKLVNALLGDDGRLMQEAFKLARQ